MTPDATPVDELAATRLRPGFADSQWFVLGRLRTAIERAIADRNLDTAEMTIVDFGAGSKPYEPLFGAADYIGCDIDTDADVTIEPGQPLPMAADTADAVVSFQVLEHVWDLDWYLSEARRLIGPDGVLLLSTHGTWPYHPHPTDFRRWTRSGLETEITERGFTIERVTPVGGPIVYGSLLRFLAIRTVLHRLGPPGVLLAKAAAVIFNTRLWIEDRVTPDSLSADNAIVYLVEARPS